MPPHTPEVPSSLDPGLVEAGSLAGRLVVVLPDMESFTVFAMQRCCSQLIQKYHHIVICIIVYLLGPTKVLAVILAGWLALVLHGAITESESKVVFR